MLFDQQTPTKGRQAGKMVTPNHMALFIALLVIIQISFLFKSTINTTTNPEATSWQQTFLDDAPNKSSLQQKHNHIASYWWPGPSNGGFFTAIHRAQQSKDCSSRSTRYLVLRSLKNNDNDNRGLSAWASVSMNHMLHAFSDGDNPDSGRRILINDDKLWPMAKGCAHGPETRECYFVPLTNCKLQHVDPINSQDGSVAVLSDAKDEYNRTARTVYLSDTAKWARMTKDKYQYSWSGLQGDSKDFPKISLVAAFLAYYLQPQPWLRKEIDARLRRSLPANLDPEKTVGVPIRRSDKCHGHTIEGSAKGELNCPTLESYLTEVKKFMSFDPNINSIIITSEDSSATTEFTSMVKSQIPQLRIITNVDDVQQGTGSASKLESYTGASNADVVASALTSLHMHLRARYFVITTKSSWTSCIAILARVYGFASDVVVIDIGPTTHGFSHLAKAGGSGY